MKRTRRKSQSGFTLLELMVVVVLIAILAAIALPSFAGQSRKAKADAEVNSFFAEFRIREEQYALENGKYFSTGVSETDTYLVTPKSTAQTLTLPTTWKTLKIRTPEATLRCAYVAIAGTSATAAGSIATTTFAYVKPPKNWFYVLAHCDMDGNTAVDSYYFISSDAATIQKSNAGS